MTTMYDATHELVGNIPTDAAIVAGYDDGDPTWCQWTPEDWARFPNAIKVHITVNPNNRSYDSQVADCEQGDFNPISAAAWAKAKIDAGKGRPTVYCSTSLFPALVQALAGVGLKVGPDVDWWEAHYDNNARLSPGSVAKQYQSTVKFDVSNTNGVWPNEPAPTSTATITDYPEDNMQKIELTLSPALDANGDGWYKLPQVVDVTNIVNVVFMVNDPQTQGYAPVADLDEKWGIDPKGEELVIENGPKGGQYAVVVWVAT